MIKARFGADLDGRIQRLFPFLARLRVHPDVLSLLGLAVSLAAAVAFARGGFRSGALLVLAGGFFDLVDGVVARQRGITTHFGAFLDSSLDRVVDMALLLALQMHYASQGREAVAWLAAWALLASVMVSYTKARAETVLPDFRGGLMERAERVLILAAGGLFGWMPWALGVVAVGATLTVGQRVALARRRMAELDRSRETVGGPASEGA